MWGILMYSTQAIRKRKKKLLTHTQYIILRYNEKKEGKFSLVSTQYSLFCCVRCLFLLIFSLPAFFGSRLLLLLLLYLCYNIVWGMSCHLTHPYYIFRLFRHKSTRIVNEIQQQRRYTNTFT